MVTLLFGFFISVMFIIIVLSNYYFGAIIKIITRYDKVPLIVVLLFNSSYRKMFYIEHKHDLSPEELQVFRRYSMIEVAMLIIFIAVVIIMNTLL